MLVTVRPVAGLRVGVVHVLILVDCRSTVSVKVVLPACVAGRLRETISASGVIIVVHV